MRKKAINNCEGLVSIDYIVGISIFIISIFFLFNVLTSMFIPFESTSDELKAMSNRISTTLVESPSGLITNALNPNIIDPAKVSELNESLNDQSKFDSKMAELGLYSGEKKYKLNISLNYINGDVYKIGSNPMLLGGSLPDEYTNVAKTSRIVYLPSDSRMLMLEVKVWL
ncbi:MAG: hypothetical protein C3F06_04720 [Candidatus Methanoperedenaceae archaeon]|nr:MAG: hypothetical protein C3F06_04720 [Candidatus Methanoperedenaceae archaeon]